MLECLAWGLVLFLTLPMLVYFCVKLGTIAYLRARDRFGEEEFFKKGSDQHGENQ